jgi:acyl carrier protein
VPSQNDIVTAIEGIIEEQLDLPRAAGGLGPDTPLFDGGLGLDSFGIVELISAIETQFSFEFQEADFQEVHFRNIGALGKLVSHYLDGSSPS